MVMIVLMVRLMMRVMKVTMMMLTLVVRYCDQQFIKAAQQEFAAAADLTNEQVFLSFEFIY